MSACRHRAAHELSMERYMGMGCQSWAGKQEALFFMPQQKSVLSHLAIVVITVGVLLGQRVQRGVAKRQDESSFFLPAWHGMDCHAQMHRAAPASFVQDLRSPAGGGRCCSPTDAFRLCLENSKSLSAGV